MVPDVGIAAEADGQDEARSVSVFRAALRCAATAICGTGLDHSGELQQLLGVVGGIRLALRSVGGVVTELHGQQGALDGVHAEVAANEVVKIFRL